jgi:hypothetical protein
LPQQGDAGLGIACVGRRSRKPKQRTRLAGRVAEFPRHRQGLAPFLGCLSEPAEVRQASRLSGQRPDQHWRRRACRQCVPDSSEMLETNDVVSRAGRQAAEPDLRGTPCLSVLFGVLGGGAE